MTEKTHAALARLGSDEERKHVYDMLAVAFNVSEADRKRPDVRATLYNAMNESILFGLVPNRDCYLVPYRVKDGANWKINYSFIVSIHGLRQFRMRHEQMTGKRLDIQFRVMDSSEIAQHIPEEQVPGAVGVEATWIDFDTALMYKEIGIQYKPRTYHGFWLERSREVDEWADGKRTGEKTWKSDTVQTARTPRDIAERRAERAALMANIPPVPLNDFEESRREKIFLNHIQEQAYESQDREPESASAMLVDYGALKEDPESGLLFEVESSPPAKREYSDSPFDSEPDTEESAGDAMMAYLDRIRDLDQNGKVPSAAMYRACVGITESAVGIDGAHNALFEWMLGRRPVDKEHPPSHEVCDYLIRKVQMELADKKSGEVTENPTFDPVFLDLLSSKAQQLSEAT